MVSVVSSEYIKDIIAMINVTPSFIIAIVMLISTKAMLACMTMTATCTTITVPRGLETEARSRT